MTKRSYLFVCMLLAALLVFGFASAAVTAPITATIELSPAFLASPGEVTVTISVSNVTNADLTKPVTLYDASLSQVKDFGTEGELLLKAGETYTWTGKCKVSKDMLDLGLISYSCKYYSSSGGEDVQQTLPVQTKLLKEPVATLLQVQRTITPQVAKPGQEGKITYIVTNAGTVSLTNIVFKENDDIEEKSFDVKSLQPGKSFKIEFPFKMDNTALTSSAKITYYSEESTEQKEYVVADQKIVCGNSSISATLASSSKGAPVNSVITLTLKLKNEGTVDFSDIRVTDPVLGDVFTNQQLAAGQELELTKDVTLTETSTYQFSITAVDSTGTESVTGTESIEITAMNPEDSLNLTLIANADKTDAYGNPADVRFTLTLTNDSSVAASKVVVLHGDVELATYETIAAGETRIINRDAALSHSGRYQFSVTAKDPLENELTFRSNEMQIAVHAPTPPPATPTPVMETPTPAPFVPATYIPASDPSVGTVPKAIRSWVFPAMIVSLVLLVACLGLLAYATKTRSDKKKASDAAYDHLERARRRDYSTPSIEEREKSEKEQIEASRRKHRELSPEQKEAQMANRRIVGEPRDEDLTWDFVKDTFRSDDVDDLTDDPSFAMKQSLLDTDSDDDAPMKYDDRQSVDYQEMYQNQQKAQQDYQEQPVPVYQDDYQDQQPADYQDDYQDQPAAGYRDFYQTQQAADHEEVYQNDYVTTETYPDYDYSDENNGYTDQLGAGMQYGYENQQEGYSYDGYESGYSAQDSQWPQYEQDATYDEYQGYEQQSSSSYDGFSDPYGESGNDGMQSAYYDPREGSYQPEDTPQNSGRRRSRSQHDQ